MGEWIGVWWVVGWQRKVPVSPVILTSCPPDSAPQRGGGVVTLKLG